MRSLPEGVDDSGTDGAFFRTSAAAKDQIRIEWLVKINNWVTL